MKKNIRSVIAMVLALIMTLISAVSASAAGLTDLSSLSSSVISNPKALQSPKSEGTYTESQKAVRANAQKVGADIVAEGTTLLKNNGGLPLKTNKVNVFGADAADPYLGGRGSACSDNSFGDRFYTALENQGVQYNKTLYNLYKNWVVNGEVSTKEYPQERTTLKFNEQSIVSTIKDVLAQPYHDELPASNLTDGIMKEAKAYSDTAIVMIGRVGSEQHDSTPDELALFKDEQDMVKKVAENFSNVIVIMNTADVFQMGFINQYPSIKSALFIGYPSQKGMDSVVKILKGEITPSGHTTDTYYYNVKDHPGYKNTGTFTYKNAPTRHFLDYKEDIYVGYRYAETFLTGKTYNQKVQFPFGYGLSYTTFEWSKPKLKTDKKDGLTVSVKVKNTGKYAGKDLVQIYVRPPYYGTIEKSAKVLAGYQKTDLLKPGDSQKVTIHIPWYTFASFDSSRAIYCLEKGDYKVELAHNAHSPADVEPFTLKNEIDWNKDPQTGKSIERRFKDYEGSFKKLSRKDGAGAMPAAPTDDDYIAPKSIVTYNQKLPSLKKAAIPDQTKDNGLKFSDMRKAAYDDPKWDQFVDQLSVKEMIHLTCYGGYQTTAIERLGVPDTNASDGPGGIHDSVESREGVSYPSGTIIASTWNPNLAFAWGDAIGKEARYMHVQEWYGPSLNLHRTPFGGRNFEYMSEDPYLIGTMGAQAVRGAQAQGLVCHIKHFALNEEDKNRTSVHTWASEQAIREIYTKPFEYAVKVGNAHGVMSALNCVGDKWAGECEALQTGLLRNEWGFQGAVVTDYASASYQRADTGLLAGNDLWLCPMMNSQYTNMVESAYALDPAAMTAALKCASKHILYMVAQTNI